jgi:hypothetical protein
MVFLNCDKCGRRIPTLKGFQDEIGIAYQQALSDSKFIDYLKQKAEAMQIGKI